MFSVSEDDTGVQGAWAVAVMVSVTLPPEQNVVGPDAVTVGAGGNELTVTRVPADGKLRHPLALVTLTV